MGSALHVNATPRMIELARTLDSGHKSFRELEWENQVLLAESELSLDGLVTEDELGEYEIEKRVRQAENPLEEIRARFLMRLNNG